MNQLHLQQSNNEITSLPSSDFRPDSYNNITITNLSGIPFLSCFQQKKKNRQNNYKL